MYRALFFVLPFPFLAMCFVMIALDGILGNVKPETMGRQTLVRVIQLRDFRRFSLDLVERLTDRAEQEFGRHSQNKPAFALHPLEKRVHVYFQTHRSNQQSHLESNLTVMARLRYFEWMAEFHSATLVRQAALMNDVVADVRYWQELYFDYLRYLGQPEPTLAELYEDFQRMIEDFKVDASPEEIVLIDSFSQSMSQALFATEIQRTIWNMFVPPSPPKR